MGVLESGEDVDDEAGRSVDVRRMHEVADEEDARRSRARCAERLGRDFSRERNARHRGVRLNAESLLAIALCKRDHRIDRRKCASLETRPSPGIKPLNRTHQSTMDRDCLPRSRRPRLVLREDHRRRRRRERRPVLRHDVKLQLDDIRTPGLGDLPRSHGELGDVRVGDPHRATLRQRREQARAPGPALPQRPTDSAPDELLDELAARTQDIIDRRIVVRRNAQQSDVMAVGEPRDQLRDRPSSAVRRVQARRERCQQQQPPMGGGRASVTTPGFDNCPCSTETVPGAPLCRWTRATRPPPAPAHRR